MNATDNHVGEAEWEEWEADRLARIEARDYEDELHAPARERARIEGIEAENRALSMALMLVQDAWEVTARLRDGLAYMAAGLLADRRRLQVENLALRRLVAKLVAREDEMPLVD